MSPKGLSIAIDAREQPLDAGCALTCRPPSKLLQTTYPTVIFQNFFRRFSGCFWSDARRQRSLLFSLDFLNKFFIVKAINKGLFQLGRPVSF
jgi:hypothetical protein